MPTPQLWGVGFFLEGKNMTTAQKLTALQSVFYIHTLMHQNFQFHAYGVPVIIRRPSDN